MKKIIFLIGVVLLLTSCNLDEVEKEAEKSEYNKLIEKSVEQDVG